MARSKNPDNYPPYYGPALLGVANTGKSLRIPTPEPHRLKQRIYAYINAVDHQERTLRMDYDLCTARKMRQVGLQHEPGFVIMSSKNHGPEADAFHAAMEGFAPTDMGFQPERTPEQDAAIEAAMAAPEPEPEDEDDPDFRNMLGREVDLDAVPEGYNGAYPEHDPDEALGDIRALLSRGTKDD